MIRKRDKPKHTGGLGDRPIEPKHIEMMQAVARGIDEIFNPGLKGHDRTVGWVLMAFDFGEGSGRANYISNASREDVIVLLKEQLARFEGMPESSEGHA